MIVSLKENTLLASYYIDVQQLS